jgi:ATP-dependent HslUV protease ATP-binding subunit HslU
VNQDNDDDEDDDDDDNDDEIDVEFEDEDEDEIEENDEEQNERMEKSREKIRKLLKSGKLDLREIEIEVSDKQNSFVEVFSSSGIEEMGFNVQNMMGNLFPDKKKNKKVTVKEAFEIFKIEEAASLVDNEKMLKNATISVETNGIIFLDEIDKIAGGGGHGGPDVSREGVQRDILPIVEGTTVITKYGPIKTDHILFIASGAFHVSKPSDLIPELQGRFPIRVELNELKAEDFSKILKDPENSLIKQYEALIKTENVTIKFHESAIKEISEISYDLNSRLENIGARRLYTICEKVLEGLLFELPNHEISEILVDSLYVKDNIADILSDEDLSKYIL